MDTTGEFWFITAAIFVLQLDANSRVLWNCLIKIIILLLSLPINKMIHSHKYMDPSCTVITGTVMLYSNIR